MIKSKTNQIRRRIENYIHSMGILYDDLIHLLWRDDRFASDSRGWIGEIGSSLESSKDKMVKTPRLLWVSPLCGHAAFCNKFVQNCSIKTPWSWAEADPPPLAEVSQTAVSIDNRMSDFLTRLLFLFGHNTQVK